MNLVDRLAGTPYESYLYAYPHKTAYGPIEPPTQLSDVWRDEDKTALFLYVHVPFCEMRCGFCNLFTTPKPKEDMVSRYVKALERQARCVADALGEAKYSRFAMGGGTPTLLTPGQLTDVLDIAERIMGADLRAIPGSVETSPETCSLEGMRLLRERGIERISIGVQSFVDSESAAVSRPQKGSEVRESLSVIRKAEIPILNIDLMYGLPQQTRATWEHSLRAALEWRPEELYLYPLYVRPVTTLSRRPRDWDDERLTMYRDARALLLSEGYEQASMRMFQKRRLVTDRLVTAREAPVYCVQDDGMVGLGPGARSYTRRTHYSTEWAVGARGVREIVDAWLGETDEGFGAAKWGFVLDEDEQRRRWVAYSLLVAEGAKLDVYAARFGGSIFDHLPLLRELEATGCAEKRGETLALTPLGLERSDTIGPWLASPDVQARMAAFALR